MATACIFLYISANPGSTSSFNPSPNPNPMELSANWTGASKQEQVDQGVSEEIKEEVLQMEAMEAGSTGQEANTTALIPTPAPEVI